jgi:hypothetical protein
LFHSFSIILALFSPSCWTSSVSPTLPPSPPPWATKVHSSFCSAGPPLPLLLLLPP